MDSDELLAADSPQIELAWHLLTVLLRLGGPAAACDLAAASAAAVSPDLVELLCRIPGSPLRISCGIVTASETAVVAFFRFVGWGAAAPRVIVKPPKVRKLWEKVDVSYMRKRKVSDAGDSGVKRRLVMAPATDLEGSKQHKQRRQLIVGSCGLIASGEVHPGVTQELQDRLATLSTLVVEPSLNFSAGVTLSSISKIKMPCYQPKNNQSFEGNDECSVPGNMASALVSKLPDAPCIVVSSLNAETSEHIHESPDNEITRIGEPEGAFSFYNCRVEDSEDLGTESSHLAKIVEPGLVDKNNGVEKDLSLIYKIPINLIDCDPMATCNIERIGAISNQAETPQYASPCAGYCEKLLTLLVCAADDFGCKGPLAADACAVINETAQSLLEPPVDTKVEQVGHEVIHETLHSVCEPPIDTKIEPAALPPKATSYSCGDKRKLSISADITGVGGETAYPNLGEQLQNQADVNFSKKGQDKNIDKYIRVKQKEKSKKTHALPKECKEQLAVKAQKSNVEPKPLPNFKSFVIEEEEGSGGYGIVYRARRKTDGRVFAIKCPHANAHSHHVNNELKMLERFGGKNFVIKYECSFRSGDLECFVLEHVEHDRPEILKKDMNVFELQWYGYCMFRALASLHRQGIVHRDVKPGNFLFSRKLNKGYLIDFNLANDLHQKFSRNCKSETSSGEKDAISQPSLKTAPTHHDKEVVGLKQPFVSKRKRSNRSPVDSIPKIDNKARYGNQAADVSGVTSAKDPTSTKTSVDRLKQPMPYRGRKEIMNFLHEAMQSPNQKTLTAPASQRKRVAAPFSNMDRKLIILTPMPLRSRGSAVAGSGMFNSKGHGKHRREGPCVGTKGFRAPEVLFRSFHQGCKVDVWSAGVTLLYLIIGKTPFGGDPEQNIKEIAKLRGSEELWEVAKLHNCEPSYPSELFDVQSLHSVNLKEWCAANTRRPEFVKRVPDSLFDLVDRCLTVNPRCRITSEEALTHEFFAPCHESLRKQRMLRRSAVSDPASLSQDILLTAKES